MIKNTLIQAVEVGAKELTRFFNGTFTIASKSSINDLVTEADHASEKAIIDLIQSQFPDHFILSEETGEMASMSDTKWIIDPIDGTINFANGIPICCVSIGVEHKGEMILGSVYNPFMNELFFAEKGKGAACWLRLSKLTKAERLFRVVFAISGIVIRAQARRCRDIGHNEVPLNSRLRAFWQSDVTNVDHVANLAACKINRHVIRNVTRQHFQLYFRTHDRQNTATLEARGRIMVDESDVNEQVNPARTTQTHQVDVGRQILDNVALDVAADHADVFLAFNLEVEKRGQEASLLEALEQRIERHVDRDRVFPAAINDPRHHAVPTCLTSGALASPRPDVRVKIRKFSSHVTNPFVAVVDILQGCMST